MQNYRGSVEHFNFIGLTSLQNVLGIMIFRIRVSLKKNTLSTTARSFLPSFYIKKKKKKAFKIAITDKIKDLFKSI